MSDMVYWMEQRAIREKAYNKAKAEYIGAGGNTYASALEKKATAGRKLAEADKRIRELEAERHGR